MNYNYNGSQDDMVKDLFEKIQNITSNILHPNIIVCGKTGVGKSTLINNVFRQNIAETGVGKPVTQHLRKIESSEVPVTLYDTRGLELNAEVQNQIREEIIDTVNCSRMLDKAENYIHAIWYCIQGGSNRLETAEEEMIRTLATSVEVPVIIVITQCFPNKQSMAFKKSIEDMNLNVSGIICVMAEDYEIQEGTVIKAYGLDKLVEITYEVLPESVQKGFINAQKVSVNAKEKAAKKYANTYIGTAFATGFIPIPYSDAPVLVGNQIIMLAHITSIFGLSIDKAFLSTVVSTILGSGSATIAGKFVVSNLIKLIPGVGTLVGGVISGTTAALLTASMARAYIKLMTMVVRSEYKGKRLENQEVFENLNYLFNQELKKGERRV